MPDSQAQSRWFSEDKKFDRELRRRFLTTVVLASEGGLDRWLEQPEGYLAIVVLLDQISRHIYRGTSMAYDNDRVARQYVRRGLEETVDQELSVVQRVFFYLPLTHSEVLEDQKQSLQLHEVLGKVCGDREKAFVDAYLQDARTRYDVIRQFGRFPHRNKVLKRASRPEEDVYLGETRHVFNA